MDDLKGRVGIDMKHKFLGRHLIMIISPVAGSKTKKEKPSVETKKTKTKKKETKKDAKTKN